MRRPLVSRLLAATAVAAFALHAAIAAPAGAGAVVVGQPGDADCSGAVNAADAYNVLFYDARLVTELPCKELADADGDLNVTVIDAALILQLAAGVIDYLP